MTSALWACTTSTLCATIGVKITSTYIDDGNEDRRHSRYPRNRRMSLIVSWPAISITRFWETHRGTVDEQNTHAHRQPHTKVGIGNPKQPRRNWEHCRSNQGTPESIFSDPFPPHASCATPLSRCSEMLPEIGAPTVSSCGRRAKKSS